MRDRLMFVNTLFFSLARKRPRRGSTRGHRYSRNVSVV